MHTPRKAYVEDAPDADLDGTVALTNAPPAAPTPPSAIPTQPVNVFDFLVTDDTPNASRVSLGGSKEQMQMVDHAPSVFDSKRHSVNELEQDPEQIHLDTELNSNGYSYGTDPILTNDYSFYQTPVSKHRKHASQDSLYDLDPHSSKSTDKKRKRQVEDLDLTQARLPSQEVDEVMA